MSQLRRCGPVLAGIAAIAVALLVPEPARPARSGAPPAGTPGAGIERLEQAWPQATIHSLPWRWPDGSVYVPHVVVDPSTSVGMRTITNQDSGVANQLVVRRGEEEPRVLRVYTGTDRWFAAATVWRDDVFWTEASRDSRRRAITTVWRSGLSTGEPVQLAQHLGGPYGSGSDLVVAEGRVHWISETPAGFQVHSVPAEGGPVTSRELDRPYTFATWPWLSTAATGQPGPGVLLNLDTGQTITVPPDPPGGTVPPAAASVGPSDQGTAVLSFVDCTPAWCRITTEDAANERIRFTARRPDGTGEQPLGDNQLRPLIIQVGLLDRFEVLGSAPWDSAGGRQWVWLHDLTTGQRVLLSEDATVGVGTGGVGTGGYYLWWTVMVGEQTQWRLLDLRQLS